MLQLSMLAQVRRHGSGKAAAAHREKPARAMMLGGMWDSDVQDEWRDSCAGFCGTSRPGII